MLAEVSEAANPQEVQSSCYTPFATLEKEGRPMTSSCVSQFTFSWFFRLFELSSVSLKGHLQDQFFLQVHHVLKYSTINFHTEKYLFFYDLKLESNIFIFFFFLKNDLSPCICINVYTNKSMYRSGILESKLRKSEKKSLAH